MMMQRKHPVKPGEFPAFLLNNNIVDLKSAEKLIFVFI